MLGTQFQKNFFGFHIDHHLTGIVPRWEQKAKQLSVALIMPHFTIRHNRFYQAIDKDNLPRKSSSAGGYSSVESAKVMPAAAVGTQILKHADNFFNPIKAFAVLQGVVLQNGFDFLQRLVALQLSNFDDLCIGKARE